MSRGLGLHGASSRYEHYVFTLSESDQSRSALEPSLLHSSDDGGGRQSPGRVMEIRVQVSGERACFKRVEFAEDLVSYDVIPPLAARGLLETIYCTPDMRWRIEEIRVLRPIRSTWMSLAEAERGTADNVTRIVAGRHDRRMANVLVDVGYVITARLEAVDGQAGSHAAIFRRRVASGAYVRQPYLGLPAFAAHVVELRPDASPLQDDSLAGAVDLGWMLYDVPANKLSGPQLFRPTMVNGIIDVRRREALMLAC
jgi:CRISPR-associated protein Cas5d